MTVTENKALLARYIEKVWHRGDANALFDFLDPAYKRHRSALSKPITREQQRQLLIGFRAAFPDITIAVQQVIGEGETIAFRSVMQGTHQGRFLDIAPTGRKVKFNLMDMIRIERGKFVEQWGGPDTYDILQQLQ